MIDDIKEYVRRRDEALRSLDWRKVKAFFLANRLPGVGEPSSDEVYKIMMHKCRVHVDSLTEEEKQLSRDWLNANGL